jgi:hypothetical protein
VVDVAPVNAVAEPMSMPNPSTPRRTPARQSTRLAADVPTATGGSRGRWCGRPRWRSSTAIADRLATKRHPPATERRFRLHAPPARRAFCVAANERSGCSRSERAFWRGSRDRDTGPRASNPPRLPGGSPVGTLVSTDQPIQQARLCRPRRPQTRRFPDRNTGGRARSRKAAVSSLDQPRRNG